MSMLLPFYLILLGIAAGLITTLAGLGGGLVATWVLTTFWGPEAAMAATSPALLLGNVHRAWLYRAYLLGARIWPGAIAGFSGAVIGAITAKSIPRSFLLMTMAALALTSVMQKLLKPNLNIPATWLVPLVFLTGFVSAVSGGGGLLLAPVLLAAGFQLERYLVVGALFSVSIHCGRMIGYGFGGWMSEQAMVGAFYLGVSIPIGNFIASKIRLRVSKTALIAFTYLVLLAAVFASIYKYLLTK